MNDELIPLQQPAILKSLRDLFRELGGSVPVRDLAQEAVVRSLLPGDVLAACEMRGVIELCKRALKAKTEDGLPFAKPTGSDEQLGEWKQMDLFTYEQAAALINREARAVLADYQELRRLHQWCLDKFGLAPDIPQLAELSEA